MADDQVLKVIEVQVPGTQGPMPLNYAGLYDAETQYEPRDWVIYNTASWFTTVRPPIGSAPGVDSAYWQLMAGGNAEEAGLRLAGDLSLSQQLASEADTRHAETSARPTFARLLQSDGAELIKTIAPYPNAAPLTLARVLHQWLTPEHFDAVGDGVTPDDEAFEKLAYALTLGFGGSVLLRRQYLILDSHTFPAGTQIAGTNRYSVGIVFGTDEAKLILGHRNTVENFAARSASARTGGVYFYSASNDVEIKRIVGLKYYKFAQIGDLGVAIAVNNLIKDCECSQPSTAAGAGWVDAIHFAGAMITGNKAQGTYNAPQPNYGLKMWNGDSLTLSDNNITGHGTALWGDTPEGLHLYALQAENNYFDNAGSFANPLPSVRFNPRGQILNTLFDTNWIGLAYANGADFVPEGAGVVDGITFDNCQIMANKGQGMVLSGPNVKNWQINGGLTAGNQNGIVLQAGTQEGQINGLQGGNVSGRGANSGVDINIFGGCHDIEVWAPRATAYYDGTGSDVTIKAKNIP